MIDYLQIKSIFNRPMGGIAVAIYKMGPVEMRFAQIIWQRQPLRSGELVRLCAQALSWKKSTTYTVLKKLCGQGIFQNEGGVVTARLSQAEYNARHSEEFVAETFGGSLPAFLAAFTSQRALSEKEAAEIRAMIDGIGREG